MVHLVEEGGAGEVVLLGVVKEGVVEEGVWGEAVSEIGGFVLAWCLFFFVGVSEKIKRT